MKNLTFEQMEQVNGGICEAQALRAYLSGIGIAVAAGGGFAAIVFALGFFIDSAIAYYECLDGSIENPIDSPIDEGGYGSHGPGGFYYA